MFIDFLYLLRSYGMKVGTQEWLALTEALYLNLNDCSFLEFYHMARAILVKKVTDYDRFDQAFTEYFGAVEDSEFSKELKEWLSHTMAAVNFDKEQADAMWEDKSLDEIRQIMAERIKEQKEAHYGGNKWVGTGGITAFGNSGYAPKGIRIGGTGGGKSALKAAGERKFRDFRDDKVLGLRQFQMALRKLRLLSGGDEAKTELSVDGTIEATCKQGGALKIVMERPRRNQTKLLLLMDSGGSMMAFADLVSRLFQAVHDGNQFKDLKIYYFHNCVYGEVFPTPRCKWEERVPTDWVLHNLKREYKMILVGDASMGPAELLEVYGSADDDHPNDKAGIAWLRDLKKRFPAAIWLNPLHEKLWNYDYSARTVGMIQKEFPMYPLTVRGLEDGIRYLLREGQ